MDPKKILVGWASRDVTPGKPAILGGQFNMRISEFVKDSVTATALALETAGGGEQAILVSLDAVWINDDIRDACRQRLKELISDFDPYKLLISVTHTHTAPIQASSFFSYPELADPDIMTPTEYSEFLTRKLIELCVESWNSRKPGAIAWGYGQAVVGFNRRTTYFNGSARMYGRANVPEFSHIEGYEDQSVDMLFTYNDKHELTGILINLACPAQVTESANFFSADFWHEAREEIRKRHGEALFILPQCSAAGDLSPHMPGGHILHRREQLRMFKLKGLLESENADENQFNLALRKEIAYRIAAAVDEALPMASSDIRDTVPFEHSVSTLQLPQRKITDDESEFCSGQMRHHQEELTRCDQNPRSAAYSSNYTRVGYFGSAVRRFNEQVSNQALPMESHVIRLGNVAFASNPFELFLDFGIRLKARSKALQTFIIQLAGGGSYVPTKKALDAQSYGAGAPDSLVGPDGGQVLIEEQLKTINGFFRE
jgi:hypothetical protein